MIFKWWTVRCAEVFLMIINHSHDLQWWCDLWEKTVVWPFYIHSIEPLAASITQSRIYLLLQLWIVVLRSEGWITLGSNYSIPVWTGGRFTKPCFILNPDSCGAYYVTWSRSHFSTYLMAVTGNLASFTQSVRDFICSHVCAFHKCNGHGNAGMYEANGPKHFSSKLEFRK